MPLSMHEPQIEDELMEFVAFVFPSQKVRCSHFYLLYIRVHK